MDIDQFIKDRDETFSSCNEKKIREYCEKYNIKIPEDEDMFWAGVHKTICNLFLNVDTKITIQQFNKSYNWLLDHGYEPSIGGEENG